jgi:hypothetical protein
MTQTLRCYLRLAPERRSELLLAARDADRGGTIAQVPAQLAFDRGRRIRGERDAARSVEPSSRRDEPDRSHLHEIVEWLAASGVAAGERTHERQVPADEIYARLRTAHDGSIFLLILIKFK